MLFYGMFSPIVRPQIGSDVLIASGLARKTGSGDCLFHGLSRSLRSIICPPSTAMKCLVLLSDEVSDTASWTVSPMYHLGITDVSGLCSKRRKNRPTKNNNDQDIIHHRNHQLLLSSFFSISSNSSTAKAKLLSIVDSSFLWQ